MSFLPDNYQVPSSQSNYMKFLKGENRFRILDSPIIGEEYWKEDPEGKRKPVRVRPGEKIDITDVEDPSKIKHFWAMPVWNYAEERVQILEITQKSILNEIVDLSKDEDWGDPKKYDIAVTRIGEELETKYSTKPKPHKEIDPAIEKAYQATTINLEALFDGEDPFTTDPSSTGLDESDAQKTLTATPTKAADDEINLEDIPF